MSVIGTDVMEPGSTVLATNSQCFHHHTLHLVRVLFGWIKQTGYQYSPCRASAPHPDLCDLINSTFSDILSVLTLTEHSMAFSAWYAFLPAFIYCFKFSF
jgi:hypothetical protein